MREGHCHFTTGAGAGRRSASPTQDNVEDGRFFIVRMNTSTAIDASANGPVASGAQETGDDVGS